jgi:multiple sugar transport system ATP-binding protein
VSPALDKSPQAERSARSLGPSGSGKTLLLRLLAGVEQPDEGSILLGGRDVTDQAPEKRGVGMAFQNFALFPHMSAFDNVASALTAHNVPRDVIRAKVEKVAALLKIEHAPRSAQVSGFPPLSALNRHAG